MSAHVNSGCIRPVRNNMRANTCSDWPSFTTFYLYSRAFLPASAHQDGGRQSVSERQWRRGGARWLARLGHARYDGPHCRRGLVNQQDERAGIFVLMLLLCCLSVWAAVPPACLHVPFRYMPPHSYTTTSPLTPTPPGRAVADIHILYASQRLGQSGGHEDVALREDVQGRADLLQALHGYSD